MSDSRCWPRFWDVAGDDIYADEKVSLLRPQNEWANSNSSSDFGEEIQRSSSRIMSASGGVTEGYLARPPTNIISQNCKRQLRPTGMAAGGEDDGNQCTSKDEHRAITATPDHPDHVHIWTERERRKKMRNMFANLHSLLPQLSSKADKSTIVDEAIGYIKKLQQSIEVLQNQKLEMARAVTTLEYESLQLQHEYPTEPLPDHPVVHDNSAWTPTHSIFSPINRCFQTWSSPNVVLSICGEDAQIGICTARKQGLLATIFNALERHKVDVVSAQISSDKNRSMYMIHAHVDSLSESNACEQAFKQVVGELMYLLSAEYVLASN